MTMYWLKYQILNLPEDNLVVYCLTKAFWLELVTIFVAKYCFLQESVHIARQGLYHMKNYIN